MGVRRTGSPTAFWGNAAVLANGVSTAVNLPRGVEQLAIYVTTSAATIISLEAAHHGALTAEGNEPDQSTPPANFFQVYYTSQAIAINMTAPGSAVIIVPDFEPDWIRLRSSAAATITAGYEVTGD